MLAQQNTAAIGFGKKSSQKSARRELNRHIDVQADSVAPEPLSIPTHAIAARLRLDNHHRVREAIADGQIYWQWRQSFKKLKDFKLCLEEQHLTWKQACKYIKLYETFAEFPLQQIAWVDIQTLFQLCQPRYKELLQQLRCLPVWTEANVQEQMMQWREATKKEKPPVTEPDTGWRQLPGGGRGYQLPLLHIDWLGTLIERARKIRNQTLSQLVRDMVVFFIQAEQVPGVSIAQLSL